MSDNAESTPARRGVWKPLLVLIALAGAAGLWLLQDRFGAVDTKALAEIAELRNVAIAELENLDLGQAAKSFEELSKRVPSERLPFQNLVVSRLIALLPEQRRADQTAEDDRRALEQAQTAVSQLATRFPGGDTHVLTAHLAATNSIHDLKGAIEELKNAAKLKPNDAALQFELYQLTKDEGSHPDEAAAHLKRCAELLPNNLYVLTEWLNTQVERRDPTIKETLTAAREKLSPFVERVEKFARLNLHQHVDKAIAAAEAVKGADDAKSWQQLRGMVAVLTNVLRPEVAWQLDSKRVQRHLLEYMQHDFSAEYYAHTRLPAPSFAPAIDVKLNVSAPIKQLDQIQAVRMADFDADSQVDVIIVTDNKLSVVTKNGAEFTEVASADLPAGTRGFALFDINRDRTELKGFKAPNGGECADSRLDLVVWGDSGLKLLLNQAGPNGMGLELKPVPLVPGMFEGVADVITTLPLDFDHDGDLDLVVSAKAGMTLWQNRDDLSFVNVTKFSTMPPAETAIHQLVAVDWNRNVSTDVVCVGNGVSGYLENLLHGQFRWQPFSGDDGPAKDVQAVAVTDSDANFSWDLITGNSAGVMYQGTTNPDAGVTKFQKPKPIAKATATGLLTWDYDNDGYLDVLSWSGAMTEVSRGGPAAQFQRSDSLSQNLGSEIKAIDVEDIDGDGDLDLAIAFQDRVSLAINDGGNANGSLRLPIRGEDDKDPQRRNERVNMHGIGSMIELKTGLNYQVQVVTRQCTHFGMGKQTQADAARVFWTNGVPDQLLAPKPNTAICLQQRLKGSCPYLYTWDGEKFTFVTDCLWGAPIGLQFAEGVHAPCRDWEYLKVDGDKLRPKNGEYHLSLTEELWEITYFDSVRLLAVDHPADTEIFSNEKVGPASISEFKLHPVRTKHSPVRAVDQRGRDVLPVIKDHDENYLRAWDVRIKQGYTEPHLVELDLGKLPQPKEVKLFLTGWMRPTDTSLNIAISQRPDLEPTQPPSVWIPDAKGEWQQVSPHMGFPGGKTKTIVVDLSNQFAANDYRVRIATTMEIFWDHIFFTMDEPPAEVKITEQPMLAAELRQRGFSKLIPHPGFGPDRYDYSQLQAHLSWPPMEGRLTGFGDVRQLVQKQDHQQVTVGAGDEMQLRFQAINNELPPGWKRDFILHNIGWDKDADLNTVFGQTVDPLPFVGMQNYPDQSSSPDQPVFANQVRVQDRAKFWRLFHDPERLKVGRGH